MRLLDPLNGVKFGQMHAIMHLTFFLIMFFIDTSMYKGPVHDAHDEHNKDEASTLGFTDHKEFGSALEALFHDYDESVSEKERIL